MCRCYGQSCFKSTGNLPTQQGEVTNRPSLIECWDNVAAKGQILGPGSIETFYKSADDLIFHLLVSTSSERVLKLLDLHSTIILSHQRSHFGGIRWKGYSGVLP